jgi:hypothetical protein
MTLRAVARELTYEGKLPKPRAAELLVIGA